ncbi:MAG TPA: PilZ domain-containing protein [Kineosporiaceae bacterium]
MASIGAGGRLTLHTAAGRVPLRALAEVELSGRWSVPVLAPLRALTDGDGVLEAATRTGMVSVAAHLRIRDGVLELCPGTAAAPVLRQRRLDVRGRLALPLRATAADPAARRAFSDDVVEGVTLDVSAGGLGVDLHPRSGPTPYGSRLYLELTLPGGRLVPSVLAVVELSDRTLHGRFVDIAPVDREHLVKLIFAAQRRELAAARERANP